MAIREGALLAAILTAVLSPGCGRNLSLGDLLNQDQPDPAPSSSPSPSPSPSVSPVPSVPSSTILFSDNFDDTPDWLSPEQQGTNISYPGTTSPPSKWDAYRSAALRFPDPADDPLRRQHFVINGESPRGGTGKALTYNVESTSGFGAWSGGGIMKYLGWPGPRELFVRFWMNVPSNFCWQSPGTSSKSGSGKLMRITSLRRPLSNPAVSPADYPNADTSPTLICNWYARLQTSNGVPTAYPKYAVFDFEARRAPNYNTGLGQTTLGSKPFPNDGQPGAVLSPPPAATSPTIPQGQGWCGDGKWHLYEYYVKMNSSPGATDGIWRVYLDNVLQGEMTNVDWVMSAATDSNGTAMTTATGWNVIWWPDNMNIFSYPETFGVSGTRMPLYFDDFTAYAPMNPSDPECAGNCTSDGRLPLNYVVRNVDTP
ncbi:MAG: hypothetical protein A2X94_05890 [Bdellovibrionales bacterium GWB1_55_8]|nr:MAG: hypothetical protein A2X94_05890 [Bdellovibrionales bacterium GWB1_55_8]